MATTLAILAGPTVASAQSAPSTGEKGALVRVVERWDATCSASNRTSWGDMVDGWHDAITDGAIWPFGHGSEAWWNDGFYQDGDIDDRDFVDPALQSWGIDDYDDRADEPDALMIAMHGGNYGAEDRWVGSVRVDDACGTGCDCDLLQEDMKLGDLDLEFLHLSSCYSMDEENWDDWRDSFDGLHQADGFHGLMWISTSRTDHYKDFANDGYDIAIADAWLDELYRTGKGSSGTDDQCPVALVAGASGADALTRLNNEEYDWVYSDPSGGGFAWTWISGCNPSGRGALP